MHSEARSGAESLGIGIGDTLSFSIGSEVIKGPITSASVAIASFELCIKMISTRKTVTIAEPDTSRLRRMDRGLLIWRNTCIGDSDCVPGANNFDAEFKACYCNACNRIGHGTVITDHF